MSFIRVAVSTEILVICVASGKFFAWYVCMFFPMALVLEERDWLRQFTVILSVIELVHFAVLQYVPTLAYILATGTPLLIARRQLWRHDEQPFPRSTPKTAFHPLTIEAVPIEVGEDSR